MREAKRSGGGAPSLLRVAGNGVPDLCYFQPRVYGKAQNDSLDGCFGPFPDGLGSSPVL